MRSNIIQNIITYIKTNGQRLITGQVLQEVLIDIVDNVGVLGEDAGLRDYNPGRVYATGETCIYQGIVFKSNTETTGNFKAGDWDMIGQMPVVATIAARDALSFKREGMLCYVLSDQTTYRLTGGLSNAHWQELGRAELHVFDFAPGTPGQQSFTIPNRPIISFKINGVSYRSDTYSLTPVDGNKQTLKWENIDAFALSTQDELSIIYTGTEVII